MAERGTDEPRRRDFFDVFTSVSAFLSSVVIAGVALWVNSTYNERQQDMARSQADQNYQLGRVQTLAAFMPHLSTGGPSREAALYGITALGYPDLAVKLTQLEGSSERDVGDAIMRTAPASTAPAATRSPTQPAADRGELGWIYLGDYSSTDRRWTTSYLDFPVDASPADLVNRTLGVRERTGALNVRRGMPTDRGEFLPVTQVLQPNTRVRVLEVKPWLTTGYNWARVAPVS